MILRNNSWVCRKCDKNLQIANTIVKVINASSFAVEFMAMAFLLNNYFDVIKTQVKK